MLIGRDRVGAVGGVVVAGCGECVESGGEHVGFRGGDGEPAMGLAVAVAAHRERGCRGCCCFFAFEAVAFDVVGDVGGDDVEDPVTESLQLDRVEHAGELQQVGAGSVDHCDPDPIGRQRVNGLADHFGLLGQHPTCAHRREHGAVPCLERRSVADGGD
ncbi:hypothetical protein BJ989_001543 [Nocardioides perillae]|uniref:Uncharacterized protein n=1 Tax=Nocardioides perillae TaxID=1119534 RepID=A0A7Y9RW67_9ACTN|nr:hypothetical protein [Nocardioides perillae]NYG55239.1 hypothetical protein [Nocardioides perillae]